MTAQSAANFLLIATAIAWILGRQLQVAPVKPRLLLLAPVVMGYFSIRDLPVRGLLYVVDLATGHPVASGLGVLLCTLAINCAAQNSVIALRMTAPAPRPGDPLSVGG
jgi:hypothetical protein